MNVVGQLAMTLQEVPETVASSRTPLMAAETLALLAAGKLEQVCPARCRTSWRRTVDPDMAEAAGFSCTACTTPTGPSDWRRAVLSDAQRQARSSPPGLRVGPNGTRRAAQVLGPASTPPPAL